MLDAPADTPVQHGQLRVGRAGSPLTRLFDQALDVLQQTRWVKKAFGAPGFALSRSLNSKI